MIGRLRTPRNRELFNLVLVAIATAIGFSAVYVARENGVSRVSLTYAALFMALYLIAHLVLRVALPHADAALLPAVALLTAIGEIEIYRIQPSLARDQSIWIVFGLVVFSAIVVVARDVRILEEYGYLCGLAALGLLAATIVLGTNVNGARLWIRFGGYQIQPGEFAKLLLVVFVAAYLRSHREVLARPTRRVLGIGIPAARHALPLLAMWGAAVGLLVLMNDLGSSLLFFSVLLVLVYVATGRALYVGSGLALFALGAFLASQVKAQVDDRVTAWLDPWKHESTTGFQITQSLYTIADGGIFGSGFGRGYIVSDAGRTYIPYAQTDFIYSVIANETGLAGAAGVVLIFVAIAYRGFKIATVASDSFSKLLATGLTFVFSLQAFLIVGGVVKEIPLTGLTLPFVSYGGSSVVANFGLIALLLCVSERANRPPDVPAVAGIPA